MTDASAVTVGVLSLHESKESKAILNAVEALGHEPEWLREENTVVGIDEGELSLEPDVDVIANRLLLSKSSQPCEELGLASTLSGIRPTLNKPCNTLVAIHKLSAAARLAEEGVPVPDVLLALSSERLNRDRGEFGEEAVYKTAIGTHGGGTWKVGPGESVSAKVGSRYAFLQNLIARDGERHRDVRIYVVGDRVLGGMYRYAPENDWRTNVALGGEVEDATDDVPEEVRELALEATDAVGLDYAGIDLIEGEDGWFVLEVNPTAGFKGFYRATGTSPAPHIAQLAIERAGGEVDEERVRNLSSTLDDSRPSCKPTSDRRAREPRTIGFTEQVVVSGTGGSTRVVAKSDTGATRTSVDTSLAAEIGAGPIKRSTKVRSGSSKTARTRPLVDLVVGVGGVQHTVTASVEDRSHMDYPLLLGRDVLEQYQVDVGLRYDESASDTEE